jgi:hypothetical protein
LLLRPNTGELFLFDDAARPGLDVRVTAFSAVRPGVALVPAEPGDDCPKAAVLDASGQVVDVDLPPRGET